MALWSNVSNDGGPYALNAEQTCVSDCVGNGAAMTDVAGLW